MFAHLELNASIDALVEVNTTVVQLVTLTQRLQVELNDIANQTTALRTMCSAASGALPAFCDMIIPSVSYTVVVNYSDVSALCLATCMSACTCVCASMCICVHMYALCTV